MNAAYALGYVPKFEVWMVLYVVIVGWFALITLAGFLFDFLREEIQFRRYQNISQSQRVIVGLGILSLTSPGLVTLFSLNALLLQVAPRSAGYIAVMVTSFGIVSFVYSVFGAKFRKAVKQTR